MVEIEEGGKSQPEDNVDKRTRKMNKIILTFGDFCPLS